MWFVNVKEITTILISCRKLFENIYLFIRICVVFTFNLEIFNNSNYAVITNRCIFTYFMELNFIDNYQ